VAYRECQAKFYRKSDIRVTDRSVRPFLDGYNAGGASVLQPGRAGARGVFFRTQETAMAAVERPNDNRRAAPRTGYPPGGRRTRGMACHRGTAGTDLSGSVIHTGIVR